MLQVPLRKSIGLLVCSFESRGGSYWITNFLSNFVHFRVKSVKFEWLIGFEAHMNSFDYAR